MHRERSLTGNCENAGSNNLHRKNSINRVINVIIYIWTQTHNILFIRLLKWESLLKYPKLFSIITIMNRKLKIIKLIQFL